MKILLFSILASIVSLSAAQSTNIICNFIIVGNDYDCTIMSSFIPDDENTQFNIIGNHQPNRNNDHVTRVFITNSFHSFVVRQFFYTFQNLQTYSYTLSTSPFRIQANAFLNATNLRTISISGTPLSVLNNHAFQGASNLETLTLAGNQLTTITQFAFAGLPNLLSIDITANQITSISDSALRQNTLLQNFNANLNDLTRIPGNLLLTNGNLLTFQASNNNVTEIGRRFLDPVPYLNVLNLNNNQCVSQQWNNIGGTGGPTKDDIRGHLAICFNNYGGPTELKDLYLELRGTIRLYDENMNYIGSV